MQTRLVVHKCRPDSVTITLCACCCAPCLTSHLTWWAAPGGSWQLVTAAAGSSLTGTCTITATVTFQDGTAPLVATTSVSLVGLSKLALYALAPDAASVPSLPPAGNGLVTGDDLVLMQCDTGRYDQVSSQWVW